MKMIFKLIFIAAAFLTIEPSIADEHWGYPDLDLNMDEEFPKWGGMCDKGKRQSPIDLTMKGALMGQFQKLEFDNYDDTQNDVTLVNNGHSIQISGFSEEMELKGGALIDEYVVEQIHLHWWSEHTIENIRYPLEVHIVHRNKRYPNMTMAANFKDGITVIGVLYHVSNEPNDAIDKILDDLDNIKNFTNINKPIKMTQGFTVRHLFPEIEGYFTYSGSLTTPSCAEAVTWIVLTETFPVTLEQVEQFKEIQYNQDKKLSNNYRELQRANNRAVVVVLGYQRGTAAMPIPMSLSYILLIVAFLKQFN